MSTSWEDVAEDMAMAEIYKEKYEQELIDKKLKEISETSVKTYLGRYGDATQERVDFCIIQSNELIKQKFYAQSLVSSSTAIELIIRFMLLRPLLQGAFLYDEWAGMLTRRIASGRTAEDKDLLPAVLRRWDIDISKLLCNGKSLWAEIILIWSIRNNVVHQAADVTVEKAKEALECARALLTTVGQIAKKLGFTLDKTGKWSEIYGEEGFNLETPFND